MRYFALIWDVRDAKQSAQAGRLVQRCLTLSSIRHPVLDRPGITVLCTHAPSHRDVQVLEGTCGVVLGTLFTRTRTRTAETLCSRARLNHNTISRVIDTRGRELIDHYWGDYIAFFCGTDGLSVRVLRGPATHLPCLHASIEGVQVYFSHMEDCARLGEATFSIDWMHLARTLFGPCSTEKTDINEVRELLPGVCEHVVPPNCTSTRLWHPLLLSDEPFEDPVHAARELRATTRTCIQTWAANFPCILHGLSGGLDSSITLSALADAPTKPHITCVTQFAEDPDSDERIWARLAATHTGCDLIERLRHGDADFRSAMRGSRTETTPGLRLPAIDRIEPDLARKIGAAAVCRGEGGDELFFRTQPALAAADFLSTRGLRSGYLSLVLHAAVTEGVTAWQVLARNLHDILFPRRNYFLTLLIRDLQGATLLRQDVIHHILTSVGPTPPGERRPRRAAPGRSWQWSLLSARRSFQGPFANEDDPPIIVPLLSQPLIETCLRIPTYFQMADRRDRALARRAFAQDLPPEILRRRDKGGAGNLAASMLAKNLDFTRSMLLDGLVVREGLIDRARLEATLAEAPSPHAVTTVPIFDLLGAEIWARGWVNSSSLSHQRSTSTDKSNEGNSDAPCRLA